MAGTVYYLRDGIFTLVHAGCLNAEYGLRDVGQIKVPVEHERANYPRTDVSG